MKRFHSIFASAVVLGALVMSGCGGGSTSSAPPGGNVLPQAAMQNSSGLNASVAQSFKISSFEHSGHRNDTDFKIVALLKLDVHGSNASFDSRDSWSCHGEGERSDKEWGDGYVYTPHNNQSLAIPAFALENPCRDENDGNGDEHRHHHRDDGGNNYYVVMVTLPNFSTNAVAGPGAPGTSAAAANDDLQFPAANAPMAMLKGSSYAFILVRTDAIIPTPTPSATATPLPTPTPCSGKNCGTPTPSPTQTPSPTPVPTATPTPCVGKNCP